MNKGINTREKHISIPNGLAGFLIKKFIRSNSATIQRSRVGLLQGIVSTSINIFLFLIKITTGIISGSISLIADAMNNLADIGSSIIVAFGFRLVGETP